MSSTVLVTGASGFLGTYTVAQLIEEGYRVIGYDRWEAPANSDLNWLISRYIKGGQYKFVNAGDISDIGTLLETIKHEKIDQVVHAAALTDLNHLKNSPLFSCQVNLQATINILEACRLFDISSIVFCSSIAVYAPKVYEPMDEKHPVHSPESGPSLFSYSTTKLSSEAFGMQCWSDLNVNFSALRFSGIYGFGMKYPLYIKPVLESAVKGSAVKFTAGSDVMRDMIYVKDAANAIVLALKTVDVSTPWRIFNIGYGGDMVSVAKMVEVVEEIIPGSDINIGPGLTEVEEQVQRARGVLDVSKAKQHLGYMPEYDIKKGINEYVDYYSSYLEHLRVGG